MRKNQKLARAILAATPVIALTALSGPASAATYIYEPFDYTSPAPPQPLLGQVNTYVSPSRTWLQAGTVVPTAINTASGSLTAPQPELKPAIGNSLTMTGGTAGKTDRFSFFNDTTSNVTSGTVYYSFTLRVDALTGSNTTIGGFFLALNNTGNSSQNTDPGVMPARMQMRSDPSGDTSKFSLGAFNNRTAVAGDTNWFNGLNVGQTYFIVGSTDVTSATVTGNARLWIDPSAATFGTATAPTADRSDSTAGANISGGLKSLLMRQSPAPFLTMDELRVANTWSEVTPTLSQYWDINAGAAGAGGASPTGTWNGSATNWSADAGGGVATGVWPGATNKAIFSAGTDATGAYTVTVSGTQSASALAVEEGNPTFSGGIVSLTGGVIEVATGSTATIASDLSSSGGLSKNFPGTLILTGSATYTGTTAITAGTLQVGNGGATGALPTSAGNAITNNGTLIFNRSNDVTQGTDFSSAAMAGTGNLTQAGSANLILNAANTFTGTTKATSGTLTATHSLALQNSTVDTGTGAAGLIVFDNALTSATVGGLNGSNTFAGNVALNLTVGNNIRNATFSAPITGTGSFTKIGSIAQELNSTSNNYSGGTNVNAGILQFGATTSMPASGAVVVNNTGVLSVHAGGTGEWTTATSGVGSIGGLIAGDGGQTAAQVTWADGSSLGINTQPVGSSTGNNLTYSGNIAAFNGSGGPTDNVGFMKRGYGTLTLTGAANNFHGQLAVANEGGTLRLTTAVPNAGQSMPIPTVSIGNATVTTPTILKLLTNDALPSNSLISLGSGVSGATNTAKVNFRLHDEDPISTSSPPGNSTLPASGSYNQTIRGISGGNGAVQVGGGVLTLNVPTGESYAYSGNLLTDADNAWRTGNLSGVHGKVIKTGQGRQDFNQINDNFTGEFVLNDGTVGIGDQQQFGGRVVTGISDASQSRLVVNGGKLMNISGNSLTLSVNYLDIGGSFTFDPNGASDAQLLGSGKLITLLTANPTITVLGTGGASTSGKFIFAAKITDNGNAYGFTKAGPGTLNMTPVAFLPNTYSGATTIQEGTIRVTLDSQLGTGSSDVNLTGGTLEFTGAPTGGAGSPRLYTLTNPLHVVNGGTLAYNTTTQNLTDITDPNGIQFVFSSNTFDWTAGTLNFNYFNLATGTTVTFRPRFTGTFNYGGPVVITNATGGRKVVLESNNTSGAQTWGGNITGTGSFSRGTGGTTLLGGSLVSVGGVSVADTSLLQLAEGGSRVIKTGTLSIGTSSSQLNLTNNKMIVTGVTAGSWNGSAYTGVSALVKSGQGTITLGQPAWNGSGVVTTMTNATASTLTTLAVAAASDVKGISGAQTALFGGQTVGATDALVAYTYTGDANLTGNVDADDYFQIDSNYNKSGAVGISYFRGDFNYDGQVNGDDYALIDASFAGQTTPFNNAGLPGGVSAVPEPATGLLTMLTASAILGNRRRRRVTRN